MARLVQANDALNQAKDVNTGFEALVALLGAVPESDAPKAREIAEIISAMHFRMRDHLDNLERCLDA